MNWVLEHLQVLIAVAAAIAYYLNRRRSGATDIEEEPRERGVGMDEQAERTRRVQEEIRRKIAERRGISTEPGSQTTSRERIPPLVRPSQVPPLDPFGGPMRRVVRKIEEAAEKVQRSIESDDQPAARTAELARQARLAEQMEQLETERAEQQRRAVAIERLQRQRQDAAKIFPVQRLDVRAALRDSDGIKRAIILREILGPPVSLRPT